MTAEEAIFARYRGKRILIDANLLLLLMIGSYQRSRIETFKRTAEFTPADFDVLIAILDQFPTRLTTPHILTEVSNLSNALPGNLKYTWWQHFETQIAAFTESTNPPSTSPARLPSTRSA